MFSKILTLVFGLDFIFNWLILKKKLFKKSVGVYGKKKPLQTEQERNYIELFLNLAALVQN